MKKRLRSAEDNLKATETENHRYMSILKEVHSKISPLITPIQSQSTSNTASTSSSLANNKISSEKSTAEDNAFLNGKSSVASE